MAHSTVLSINEASATRVHVFLSSATNNMDSLQALSGSVEVSKKALERAERKILELRDHSRIEEANDRLANTELKELQRLVKQMAPIVRNLKELRTAYVASEMHPADDDTAEAQSLLEVIVAADREYEEVLIFLSRYL